MAIEGTLGDVADEALDGVGAGRTIVGTEGDDRIEGTDGSDVILADPLPYDDRGGDDQVWGFGGDDLIRAFGGDNFVDGGSGADELFTADGDDVILGGPGDDELQGGRGRDLLHGGQGDDEVRGGEGDDTLHGDAGADRVIGSSGDDLIYGGLGPDALEGREGVDRFAWTSPDEGRDTILDFELGVDRLELAGFLSGLHGEGDLPQYLRFVPLANGTGSLLQVDPNGASGPAAWHPLAVLAGQPKLQVLPLFQVGDLAIEGHAPAKPWAPLAYVASHDDLIPALGADAAAGKHHYLAAGYAEGRAVTFDGLQYIATYGDLIQAFGPQANAGARHFIRNGFAEDRERDAFDAVQYLANYADLQAAFGTDLDAATRHYITNGYAEERTDQPLAAASDFLI